MNQKRLVIAGGSGFIGRALAQEFSARHYEIVVLTRAPRSRTDGVRELAWDGVQTGDWIQALDGAAAVINLAGKNINCPHTPDNLRAITVSRVAAVNALAAAMKKIAQPPRVWVQASATGFYGDTGDQLCDESAPAGSNALADICRQWEAAFRDDDASSPKSNHDEGVATTRKVTLRIGFVLGRAGGALPVLGRLTKWFLGGAVGNGRQFISWIHLADLVQMFVAAVEQENLSGTFNASRRTRSRMRSSCGRCGACCTGRGVRPRRRSR